jgi:hypothetical protein
MVEINEIGPREAGNEEDTSQEERAVAAGTSRDRGSATHFAS